MLEEEVDQALGCRSYERAEDRRGYRNGAETGCVPRSVEKEQRTSTPSSGYQIKRQPPRVREPRSDVGSRRCVAVESGQRR